MDTLRAAIVALLRERTGSICPSEVARALGGARWRERMDEVRAAGRALAAEGRITWTQKGAPVDPAAPRGPVRFVRGPRFDA